MRIGIQIFFKILNVNLIWENERNEIQNLIYGFKSRFDIVEKMVNDQKVDQQKIKYLGRSRKIKRQKIQEKKMEYSKQI